MYYSSQTQFPSLEGPKFNRGTVMLASAKEGLYHPHLPTFRRMDMDTVSEKLPYEHCRTTTNLTRDDFRHAAVTLFRKTKEPLREEFNVENESKQRPATDYGRPETRSLHEASRTSQSQRPYTNSGFGSDLRRMHPDKLGELFPAFRREPDESSFSKRYKFQYIPPHVRPEQYSRFHFVDWTGIRPIPANTYSRYRDAHPMYSENIASRSWKP
ncbi:uncharacterized protein LOC114516996 isoform X2 [Dendronephthya gigantea]|uniref:uncharacterized protein LOC114516996 isoform X2 n=1 Tax=Dendronephthya gigantea TaxID=151771 RepID=UPI00106D67F6|nr:uncharacterized protein LOC114516996 isoform X2 [Dendronephthya gigantea]